MNESAFQASFLLRESVFESDVLRGAQDTKLHAASLREPIKFDDADWPTGAFGSG
jgi:hypothetical protein